MNSLYYDKYIKYKNKYLELKKQQGGLDFIIEKLDSNSNIILSDNNYLFLYDKIENKTENKTENTTENKTTTENKIIEYINLLIKKKTENKTENKTKNTTENTTENTIINEINSLIKNNKCILIKLNYNDSIDDCNSYAQTYDKAIYFNIKFIKKYKSIRKTVSFNNSLNKWVQI